MCIGFSTTNRSEIKEKQLATSVEQKLKNHFQYSVLLKVFRDYKYR
jgi:hypothetical protein